MVIAFKRNRSKKWMKRNPSQQQPKKAADGNSFEQSNRRLKKTAG